MWGFAAGSDPSLDWAAGLAAAQLGVGAAIVAALPLARVLHGRRARREATAIARWTPVFLRAIAGERGSLCALAPGDTAAVLRHWLAHQELVRGEATERLDRVARAAGLDRAAQRLLGDRRLSHRLLAVAALGHLRDRSAWAALAPLADASHPVLSIAAARALVQIDPAAGLRIVLPLVVRRTDWPPARVGPVLQQAGPDLLAEPLARAVLAAPAERVPSLLPYLSLSRADVVRGVVRQLLTTSQDPAVIRECLALVNDPPDVALARIRLDHPDWLVRMEAARAVGRLGDLQDVERLRPLLGDTAWWVRYRTAQALASLPGIGASDLARIAATHANPFARDMLRHVIAEGVLA